MENKTFHVYKKEQTSYWSSMETFRRKHPTIVCCCTLGLCCEPEQMSADWHNKQIVLLFSACNWRVIYTQADRTWNKFLFLHKPRLLPRSCNWYEVRRNAHQMCEFVATLIDVAEMMVQSRTPSRPFHSTNPNPFTKLATIQEDYCPEARQLHRMCVSSSSWHARSFFFFLIWGQKCRR